MAITWIINSSGALSIEYQSVGFLVGGTVHAVPFRSVPFRILVTTKCWVLHVAGWEQRLVD